MLSKLRDNLHLGVAVNGGLKLGGLFSRDRKYGEPLPWLTVDGSLGMGSEDYLEINAAEAWNALKTKHLSLTLTSLKGRIVFEKDTYPGADDGGVTISVAGGGDTFGFGDDEKRLMTIYDWNVGRLVVEQAGRRRREAPH